MAERRGRIDAHFRRAALDDLALLPITVDIETPARAWTDVSSLAETHRLTVYDAAYLELAGRRMLPLATLDAALRRAGEAMGIVTP
jgi:predicted nucleic acid-binding protein